MGKTPVPAREGQQRGAARGSPGEKRRKFYSQVRGGHVYIVDVDIEKFFDATSRSDFSTPSVGGHAR